MREQKVVIQAVRRVVVGQRPLQHHLRHVRVGLTRCLGVS